MSLDTIAAISTPLGEGGIGIVRISGPRAIECAETIFRSSSVLLADQPPNTVCYGAVVDPTDQHTIDEVLVTVMRAPRTYTRDDVVEINCHGGIKPLRETLELVLGAGARLAEPGEFTKRAFLSGRIDLSQAEAVMDIIRAHTDAGLRVAMRQLEGHLSAKVKAVRARLLDIAAHLEAAVDFSDEDVQPVSSSELADRAESIARELDELIENANRGKIVREGITAAIVGRPNVGKSSLLNALLREDRAIVTAQPGTTRDMIEERLDIKGIPVKLQDTAGIREPSDPAEQCGVGRSRNSLQGADLLLVVIDSSEPLTKDDFEVLKEAAVKKSIVALNKSDLPRRLNREQLRRALNGSQTVEVCATSAQGLDRLEDALAAAIFSGEVISAEETVVSNVRHLRALKRAKQSVDNAAGVLRRSLPEEVTALLASEALEALGEIVGETTTEDLLDQIFGQFCIGK